MEGETRPMQAVRRPPAEKAVDKSPTARSEPREAKDLPVVEKTKAESSLVVWGAGLYSAIALFLAFPPAGLSGLAWFALVGWIVLVRLDRLPGKRPYLVLYACGVVHWALLLHFVRLPHWAGWFGLAAVAAYLGIYPVLFIWVSRLLVHGRRWPFTLACPIVWIALEWARSWMFTGMPLATLGHSLVGFPILIQTADLFGGYTVSLVVALVNCAIAAWAPIGENRRRYVPTIAATGVLLAALAYGGWRLNQTPPGAADDPLKVVLLQGKVDTHFGEDRLGPTEIFEEYRELAAEARRIAPDAEVILYPESMFPFPEFRFEKGELPADQREDAERRRQFDLYLARGFDPDAIEPTKPPYAHLILGSQTVIFPQVDDALDGLPTYRVYNSALWIGEDYEPKGRYSKRHLVMFGEYIPGGDFVPWVYSLSPQGRGLAIGEQAETFEIDGKRLMPLICFESVVPQYVVACRQELVRRGEDPDYLVNLTNDGWFWGSSLLDLHFAGNAFRAVEQRRPMLVAANTGFSATIDGNGVVREKGPRRDRAVLVDDVPRDGRSSLYAVIGDWPMVASVGTILVAIATGWVPRRKRDTSERGA